MQTSRRGLSYRDIGTGIPIVWVHGFPLNGGIFDAQGSIRGARHIMPDLRGFGSTPPSGTELTVDDYARDVLDLADELAIERAVFAGLSMGGYVVFAIARHAPRRFLGAILLDTRETADADAAREQRYKLAARVRENGVAVLADEMLPKLLSRQTHERNAPLVERVRDIVMQTSTDGAVAALHALAQRPDSSVTLSQLPVPTAIVVGKDDVITPPADAERMLRLSPHASIHVIEDGGHLANMENPAAVNADIEEFVSSLQ